MSDFILFMRTADSARTSRWPSVLCFMAASQNRKSGMQGAPRSDFVLQAAIEVCGQTCLSQIWSSFQKRNNVTYKAEVLWNPIAFLGHRVFKGCK